MKKKHTTQCRCSSVCSLHGIKSETNCFFFSFLSHSSTETDISRRSLTVHANISAISSIFFSQFIIPSHICSRFFLSLSPSARCCHARKKSDEIDRKKRRSSSRERVKVFPHFIVIRRRRLVALRSVQLSVRREWREKIEKDNIWRWYDSDVVELRKIHTHSTRVDAAPPSLGCAACRRALEFLPLLSSLLLLLAVPSCWTRTAMSTTTRRWRTTLLRLLPFQCLLPLLAMLLSTPSHQRWPPLHRLSAAVL